MKLEENVGFVKASEDFEKKQFSISASATAFKVLSSTLYQNKIRAIIRELSCNAVDAMKVVGTLGEKRFILQLPNRLVPTFRIRDFGTGLSPDDIENIYTTYFESTKRSSNEQIGCLGLGSKTPFCYTDNFQVHSYYDGIKYSYNLMIDEMQMPQILKVAQTATAEPNGLEIIMAVKNVDIDAFLREAVNTYIWFEPENRPEVIGQTINMSTWDKENENFLFSEREGNWSWRMVRSSEMVGPYVVMGGVAYALDKNSFSEASTDIQSILNMNVHIIVPIGSVNPAANRENLHLDNKSKKLILEKLAQINKRICAKIDADIENSKNAWEAYFLWQKLNAKFDHYFHRYLSTTGYIPKYKKKTIQDLITLDFPATVIRNTVTRGAWNPNSNVYEHSFYAEKSFKNVIQISSYDESAKVVFRDKIPHHFFWVPKDSKRNEKHVRNFVSKILKNATGGSSYHYNETIETFVIYQDRCVKQDGSLYTFDEVKEKIDCPEKMIVSVDDLDAEVDDIKEEVVEEQLKLKRVKKKDEAYAVSTTSTYRYEDKVVTSNLSTVDLTDGKGYYFECFARKPMRGTDEISPVSLVKTLHFLSLMDTDFKASDKTAYGFSKSQIQKLEDDTKWINVFELEKKYIDKLKTDGSVTNYLITQYSNINSVRFPRNNAIFDEFISKLSPTHEITLLAEEVKAKIKAIKDAENADSAKIRSIWTWLNTYSSDEYFSSLKNKVVGDQAEMWANLNEKIRNVWKKYPIMEIVFPIGYDAAGPINLIAEQLVKCV